MLGSLREFQSIATFLRFVDTPKEAYIPRPHGLLILNFLVACVSCYTFFCMYLTRSSLFQNTFKGRFITVHTNLEWIVTFRFLKINVFVNCVPWKLRVKSTSSSISFYTMRSEEDIGACSVI